jgi:HSP20 family protein
MNTLIRYSDPFDRMVRSMQQAFDRNLSLFNEADLFAFPGFDSLAVDVTTSEQQVVVKTAIPGVKEDDIKLDVQGNILTISAETKDEHEDQQANWYLREMRYGKFSRSVQLPEEVASDKAEATLHNGILTVTLPKAQPNPVKNIAVKAKQLLTGTAEKK